MFFKVYHPTAEEAFKAKIITDAIKEETKPTLKSQAEQARQRLCTQTQPITPAHYMLVSGDYFDGADETTNEGLQIMSAWVGTFLIGNWGPRIGHVCGAYPGRRNHSLLIQDLWFYLVLVVAGQESIARICATQSVLAVEEMVRLGYAVMDMELWLPTGKTVRGNAEKVAAARVYRTVGAGKVANALQGRPPRRMWIEWCRTCWRPEYRHDRQHLAGSEPLRTRSASTSTTSVDLGGTLVNRSARTVSDNTARVRR